MPKSHHALQRAAFIVSIVLILAGLVPNRSLFGQMRINGGQTRILTNIQTGDTYAITVSDCGKLLSFSNPGQVSVTLPEAGPNGLAAGCWIDVQNTSASSVTLTAINSLIDRGSSVTLTINQGLKIVSDGTAYLTQRGQGSGSSGGSGSGSVTNNQGDLAPGSFVTGNGGSDVRTPVPSATMDNNGNVSIPGVLTTHTSCGTCGSAIDLVAGTDPGPSQTPNSFSWVAPASIPAAYRWKLPSGDGAGAIASDGAATPGTLSIIPFSGTGNIARTTSPAITTPTLIEPTIASYKIATLPAGTPGKSVYVTDAASASDCAIGGGTNTVLCVYTGAAWVFPGPSSTGSTGGSGGSGTTGGGSSVAIGPYNTKPVCSTTPWLFLPNNWGTHYYCDGAGNETALRASGKVTPPARLTSPTTNAATLVSDGYHFENCYQCFVSSSAAYGPTSTVEIGADMLVSGGSTCGAALVADVNNMIIWGPKGPNDINGMAVRTVIAGVGTVPSATPTRGSGNVWYRIRNASSTLYFETSTDGQTWTSYAPAGSPFTLPASTLAGTLHAGFACDGGRNTATVYHLQVY